MQAKIEELIKLLAESHVPIPISEVVSKHLLKKLGTRYMLLERLFFLRRLIAHSKRLITIYIQYNIKLT